MGDAQERGARSAAERDRAGKLIARAEWEFGALGRAGGSGASDTKARIVESLKRQNAGVPKETPAQRKGGAPEILAENVLAWEVLVRAFAGRQFLYRTIGMGAPMGGVMITSEVAGFDYVAVLRLIEFLVPFERHREVFEKFSWIEQHALNAVSSAALKRAGGGNAKGSDSQAGGEGRRNSRARPRGQGR